MKTNWCIEWSNRTTGDRGIRPRSDDKDSPEFYEKRHHALDRAAHLTVRSDYYTYKAVPAIGRKHVGPYKSKRTSDTKGTP